MAVEVHAEVRRQDQRRTTPRLPRPFMQVFTMGLLCRDHVRADHDGGFAFEGHGEAVGGSVGGEVCD